MYKTFFFRFYKRYFENLLRFFQKKTYLKNKVTKIQFFNKLLLFFDKHCTVINKKHRQISSK